MSLGPSRPLATGQDLRSEFKPPLCLTLIVPPYSLSPDETTLVWSNRMFCPELLSCCPRGLPAVVQSAPSITTTELGDLWTLAKKWQSSDPAHGLELLDSE